MLPRPSRDAGDGVGSCCTGRADPLTAGKTPPKGCCQSRGAILQDGHVAGLGCKVCFETQSENQVRRPEATLVLRQIQTSFPSYVLGSSTRQEKPRAPRKIFPNNSHIAPASAATSFRSSPIGDPCSRSSMIAGAVYVTGLSQPQTASSGQWLPAPTRQLRPPRRFRASTAIVLLEAPAKQRATPLRQWRRAGVGSSLTLKERKRSNNGVLR